jgi:hypothetical protein
MGALGAPLPALPHPGARPHAFLPPPPDPAGRRRLLRRARRDRSAGRGLRVRQHRARRQGPGRCRPRRDRPRRPRLPRRALRRRPDRRAALARPTAARSLARRARRHPVLAELLAAPDAVHRRHDVRGLPVPQRVHAVGPDARRRPRPPGPGLDPRRRLRARRGPRLRPGAARRRGHRGRDGQLPPRRAGLPRAPGAGRPPRRRVRQLRPDGPAGRAALGPREHRALRR